MVVLVVLQRVAGKRDRSLQIRDGEARLAASETTRAELEARWETERQLVEPILSLRARLRALTPDSPEAAVGCTFVIVVAAFAMNAGVGT